MPEIHALPGTATVGPIAASEPQPITAPPENLKNLENTYQLTNGQPPCAIIKIKIKDMKLQLTLALPENLNKNATESYVYTAMQNMDAKLGQVVKQFNFQTEVETINLDQQTANVVGLVPKPTYLKRKEVELAELQKEINTLEGQENADDEITKKTREIQYRTASLVYLDHLSKGKYEESNQQLQTLLGLTKTLTIQHLSPSLYQEIKSDILFRGSGQYEPTDPATPEALSQTPEIPTDITALNTFIAEMERQQKFLDEHKSGVKSSPASIAPPIDTTAQDKATSQAASQMHQNNLQAQQIQQQLQTETNAKAPEKNIPAETANTELTTKDVIDAFARPPKVRPGSPPPFAPVPAQTAAATKVGKTEENAPSEEEAVGTMQAREAGVVNEQSEAKNNLPADFPPEPTEAPPPPPKPNLGLPVGFPPPPPKAYPFPANFPPPPSTPPPPPSEESYDFSKLPAGFPPPPETGKKHVRFKEPPAEPIPAPKPTQIEPEEATPNQPEDR